MASHTKHTHTHTTVVYLHTSLLCLAVLVIHWVIRGPFKSKTPRFILHWPTISFLFCSAPCLSPVSVWSNSEWEATPSTIRLKGSLPAITPGPQLFLSYFLHSLHLPNPSLPSSPFSFPSSLALPANPKPHLLLPSSTKHTSLLLFLFTNLRK